MREETPSFILMSGLMYIYVYWGSSPPCSAEVLLLLIKLRWVIDVRRSNDQPCDAASPRKKKTERKRLEGKLILQGTAREFTLRQQIGFSDWLLGSSSAMTYLRLRLFYFSQFFSSLSFLRVHTLFVVYSVKVHKVALKLP